MRGVARERGEGLEPLRLETLIGQDPRDADRLPAGKLDRVGRGDEHLREIHPRAHVAEGGGVVVGVHAAVAVKGHAEGRVLAGLPAGAECGNHEAGRIAAHAARGEPEGARISRRRARDRVVAVRVEVLDADVIARSDEGHRRGIDRGRQRREVQRDARARHGLAGSSVSIGEIAIRRERAGREEREYERSRETQCSSFHGVLPSFPFLFGSGVQMKITCAPALLSKNSIAEITSSTWGTRSSFVSLNMSMAIRQA